VEALVKDEGVRLAGRFRVGEQEVPARALCERPLEDGAEKEADEPVGESGAHDEQIVFGESPAERIQRGKLALELPDKLDGIRVPEEIARIGRCLSKKVAEEGPRAGRVREIHRHAVEREAPGLRDGATCAAEMV